MFSITRRIRLFLKKKVISKILLLNDYRRQDLIVEIINSQKRYLEVFLNEKLVSALIRFLISKFENYQIFNEIIETFYRNYESLDLYTIRYY